MAQNSKTFYQGDVVFREGESSNYAYFIDSGKVGIYREDNYGKRYLVRELGKGDLFGEMGLIDKYPRSATVIALEYTECTILERSRFDYLKKFNPQFMAQLIKSFTQRLRATITKLNEDEPVIKPRLKKNALPNHSLKKGE